MEGNRLVLKDEPHKSATLPPLTFAEAFVLIQRSEKTFFKTPEEEKVDPPSLAGERIVLLRLMKIQYLLFSVGDSIGDREVKNVEKAIGNAAGKHLHLVIESPGGDPFSAVAIMNMLQSRFEKISGIVPDYAMSAATLMMLGTDEVYMNERSSLGPLDLPIEHPTDGSRISALDVQQTVTTIASLVDSIAQERYDFLRQRKLSKKDAAHIALEYSNKFVEAIVKQVDPYHLQKANRELRIGLFYAYDLLQTRMMKGKDSQAFATARALVNNYPAHEYSIFKNEAISTLALTIKDLDAYPVWTKHLKEVYQQKAAGRNAVILYNEIEEPNASKK